MNPRNPFAAVYAETFADVRDRTASLRETHPHLMQTSLGDEIATVERMATLTDRIAVEARTLAGSRPFGKIESQCFQVEGSLADLLEDYIGSLLAVIEAKAETEDDAVMTAHRNRQDEMRVA